MTNRLAGSTSPYLLQHADNPVDWWPWTDAAFERARAESKPVLLSVGYAACHWCHVMAHESFEDVATADYLNEHFVCIKVDREERPDVDAVYMGATQAMTGQGGWPMTCALTPDGAPFFAGTYFPIEPRHGMPSFRQVLAALVDAWDTRRDQVDRVGADVVARLQAANAAVPGLALDANALDAAVTALAAQHDEANGGFGGAPKFPPSMVCEFLLRQAARTGSRESLRLASSTLTAMARGGMYDQLGGGFARYSVDAGWVVPHFEKMLYDNALLLRAYLHWWRQTGDPLGRRVAGETADFLLRDLATAQGGFASALDADTDGVEGATYVWTPSQLVDVLGPADGDWAAQLLGVTPGGTFEHGSSVLQLRVDPDDPARWSEVRGRLLAARATRQQPGRDDKVVAAWNGLAVTALAEAGVLLDEPAYLRAALAAGELLASVHLDPSGRLLRTSRDGVPGSNAGVLDDHGCVADAWLALLGLTGDPVWLGRAERLLERVLDGFAARDGGFHDTAADAATLVARPRDLADNASPAGTSAAAGALLTYAAVTGSSRHRHAAERGVESAAGLARQAPRFAGWILAVAEALIAGPVEVAVVGADDDPDRRALHRAALSLSAPGTVVVAGPAASGDADAPAAGVPLLAGRGLVHGEPAAYVCRGFVCRQPVTDPADLAAASACW
ncbi:thioredoxin domain-containing protein [soil metagenome]